MHAVIGATVTLAYVDQGYTWETAATADPAHAIDLEVLKLSAAKRGFVFLSRYWVS